MVVMTGDPVMDPGLDKRMKQAELLRLLSDTPDLSNCGPAPFEKLRMYYSGGEWVVEMEVTVDEEEI